MLLINVQTWQFSVHLVSDSAPWAITLTREFAVPKELAGKRVRLRVAVRIRAGKGRIDLRAKPYDANGKVILADESVAGKEQSRGVALKPALAGEIVDILHEGEVAGFDVSALSVDDFVYLGAAGALDDTAGTTTTVPVARVIPVTNQPADQKLLRVFTNWQADWS